MRNKPCLRAASYLSAATPTAPTQRVPMHLLTVDPDHGNSSKKIIEIESMGARAFGGKTIPMPDDPTNYQACDHGFTEWFIPPKAKKHPMVLVHGSSTRTYQTDVRWPARLSEHLLEGQVPCLPGRPAVDRARRQGLRRLHVESRKQYLLGAVRLHQTASERGRRTLRQGRSSRACSSRKIPRSWISISAISMSSSTTETNNVRESTALAILLDELYAEYGKGAILHTHSSSHARGLWPPRRPKTRRPNRLGTERRSALPRRRVAAADPAR